MGNDDLQNKKWLTVIEAAEYLGTTQGAIRNRLYRQQLISYKLHGRTLLKRDEIDRLIEASSDGGKYVY